MSTQAELLTICPLGLARELDILEYPLYYYDDADDDAEILTTIERFEVRSSYEDACFALGVKEYNPAKQEVLLERLVDTAYLDEKGSEIQRIVVELLESGSRVFLKVCF